MFVDDPQHPRLEQVRQLRSPDRVVRRSGMVVVEGFTIVERLLQQGRELEHLVVTPPQWQRLAPRLHEQVTSVTVVDQITLANAAGFDVHRGVVAFVAEPTPPPWDHVVAGARTLVVVEGLNDAENLGALIRSSWALGADALVLDPTTLDPFGRRVVRVSMGAALDLPVVRAPAWPSALDEVRRAGVQVLALTPRPDAVAVGNLAITSGHRVAVMVGAEGPGLSAAALHRVDLAVRIPMRLEVDSLNVAHAAAIALAALDRAPTITP